MAAANREKRADSGELKDWEKRGIKAREAGLKLAKVYVYFCSPYTGPHLFGQTEPGWTRGNAAVRFDAEFLENRRIGDFLDLLNCTDDEETKEQIREGYQAIVEQVRSVSLCMLLKSAHQTRFCSVYWTGGGGTIEHDPPRPPNRSRGVCEYPLAC